MIDLTKYLPTVISNPEETYLTVGSINRKTFYIGGKDGKELWCFVDGKASLVCDDVKLVKIDGVFVDVFTTGGKVILFTVD